MLDDTTRYDANQQLAQGMPVYDVNGDKVGTVADLDEINNTVIIQKGLFFPKDFPVPMSTIAGTNADGVYLSVSKDDVTSGNFASVGTEGYASDRMVDTQTPYDATAARSVGDEDLDARAAASTDSDVAVPMREEELIAGNLPEETGHVLLGKDMVEEQQPIDVPVTREDVRGERVHVEGADDNDVVNASDTGYADDLRTSERLSDTTPTVNP